MNKKFMFSAVVLMFILTLTLVGCNTKNNNDVFNSNASIKVYTRDTTSGTRDGFFSKIGFEDAVKDNSALVEGYSQVESNGSMVNSVKIDEYGIGYISLASLDSSGCKALIYNGVMPSIENVNNSTYELTRNFNYLTRAEGTYSSNDKEAIIQVESLVLNLQKRTCVSDTQEIELTTKEFDMLQLLMKNYPNVVSRETILNEIWGSDAELETRTIDMHIRALRQKLDNSKIKIRTVYGMGYKLKR